MAEPLSTSTASTTKEPTATGEPILNQDIHYADQDHNAPLPRKRSSHQQAKHNSFLQKHNDNLPEGSNLADIKKAFDKHITPYISVKGTNVSCDEADLAFGRAVDLFNNKTWFLMDDDNIFSSKFGNIVLSKASLSQILELGNC